MEFERLNLADLSRNSPIAMMEDTVDRTVVHKDTPVRSAQAPDLRVNVSPYGLQLLLNRVILLLTQVGKLFKVSRWVCITPASCLHIAPSMAIWKTNCVSSEAWHLPDIIKTKASIFLWNWTNLAMLGFCEKRIWKIIYIIRKRRQEDMVVWILQ